MKLTIIETSEQKGIRRRRDIKLALELFLMLGAVVMLFIALFK